ncbi:MAG: bifunctional DNA primase/polymerase, partial [Anaerolineae bacterium]|nr:bifunctional DNA primase/polymerase [Anaerolineae bacterium]
MLAAVPGLSSIQQQAYKLFHAGLNVFPLPHGAKAGYPWKPLQYTRLHRTHHFLGIIPLFAGACNIGVMCGATSGNLFVIDCESHEIFMQHIAALQNRRIPVWAVLTARGGHIYLRCREGEVANIRPGILPFAELRGQHGYVLAAESLHPAGSVYTWLLQEGDLPPMVEAARINWLVDRRGLPVELTVVPNRLNRHTRWTQMMVSPFSNLSKTTKEYLAEGHRIPEGSRNNRLFAAACDLAGNDYDQSEIEALLVPLALVSGLPQHEILLTIASACSRSRQPSRPPQ